MLIHCVCCTSGRTDETAARRDRLERNSLGNDATRCQGHARSSRIDGRDAIQANGPFEIHFQTKFKLGSLDAVAVAQSRRPEKVISRVTIRLGGTKENIVTKTSQMGEIKNMLQDKYGPPSTHDHRDAGSVLTEEFVWNFPSTTINLQLQNISAIDLVILSVTYQSVSKTGLL